jgi:aminobutyraldehyde dehydrogenase
VLDPAKGTALAQINEATEAQVDSAVRAADQGVRRLVADHAQRALAALLAWPTPSKPTARSWPGWNRTTAASPSAALNDEIPAIADVFRLLRRCGALPGRLGGGRIPAGPHLDDPPRPAGRGGLHRAVELPADDAGLEDRPGPGRRQHRGDQIEQTPLTALRLGELAKDLLPAGVLNILFGRGQTVGNPLVTHPKVRMVSLTGSIPTGAHIIRPPPTA